MASHPLDDLRVDDVVLDALPDQVAAMIEVRDAYIAALPPTSGGLEFLVADLQRWTPGARLRIAFLDGPTDLHRDVAEATREITDACSLDLDFGFDEETGRFRTWSESDTEHSAEIRVSFDQSGFWSLVGTDSADDTIAHPSSPVGGHPWQRSLNLGGFVSQRPSNWQGVVRHEFLHALAFKHAHQNMRGPCQDDFRWDDDEGYVPTTDEDGRFGPDASGRVPGIYTYLAGFPNFWPRTKVDHNLRTADEQSSVAGPFDAESVMLYRFAPFFYKTDPSACAPTGDGITLSAGDRRGLQLLYPSVRGELEEIAERRRQLRTLVAPSGADSGLESMAEPSSAFARRADHVLADSLSALPSP